LTLFVHTTRLALREWHGTLGATAGSAKERNLAFIEPSTACGGRLLIGYSGENPEPEMTAKT
jgi:hypothetical protein